MEYYDSWNVNYLTVDYNNPIYTPIDSNILIISPLELENNKFQKNQFHVANSFQFNYYDLKFYVMDYSIFYISFKQSDCISAKLVLRAFKNTFPTQSKYKPQGCNSSVATLSGSKKELYATQATTGCRYFCVAPNITISSRH